MQLSEEGQAYEAEFKDVMGTFQEHHEEAAFDPLPILTRIAEILEWASQEYFSHNPDPLDTRNPLKVLPNCALGHLLRHLHRNTDFFDKAMVSYLMPHERTEVNVMSARVLVSAMPVLDPGSFTTDVIKELYNYALTSGSRELRAYSTLLINAGMTPENAHIYRNEIFHLITDSLNKLRTLYDEMVSSDTQNDIKISNQPRQNGSALPTDFSALQNEQQVDSLATSDGQATAESSTPPTAETARPSNQVQTSISTKKRQFTNDEHLSNDIPAKRARSLNKDEILASLSTRRGQNGGSTPLADSFNDGLSNCSSTVDDMRRIIVGNTQIYPLTIEMEQRMILQFLQSICEFTDHLSILSENKALEIVMRYLNVNEYNDIRLLFEALYCLGTMLIHLRLAWDFTNAGGLEKLITVNRHSVAAVSVCVCLHHMSQFTDILEHVCQGPTKLLDDIVGYALWQLSHGYESSCARICGFLGYALQFKNILDRFEQMDGLRLLYNYASSRTNEFLDTELDHEQDHLQEKITEYGVILRNACTVLQRYMTSHVLLKYESIKRHHPNLSNTRFNISSGRMALKDLHKKPLVLEPETEPKALELLLNTLPFIGSWHPTNALRNLGFINFFIRTLEVRVLYEYHLTTVRQDATKLVLNTLRLATVAPGVINDLCVMINFKDSKKAGIGILLDLIENNDTPDDAEVVKLALRVLVHCFCGPESANSHGPSTSTPSVSEKFRSPADALSLLTQKRSSKHPRYFHEDNKVENVLKRAWECAQTNNAIMALIAYIRQPTPATEADSLRAISCRALNGLTRHEPVRQIISQLPLIKNNEIALLLREPILQDKHAEHAEFRQLACQLIQIIHKTQMDSVSQDVTLERMWRNSVIKQTNIRFDDNELLKLIQDHLRSKGLNKTAEILEQEAGPLAYATIAAPKSFVPPNQTTDVTVRTETELDTTSISTSADETARSVVSSPAIDISTSATPKGLFTRPGLIPGTAKIFRNIKPRQSISFSSPKSSSYSRTVSDSGRRAVGNSSLLAQSSLPFSSRYQEPAYPVLHQTIELKPQKSLGEIVTEYFRNQHAACEKPIVTCPPFSFYYPHRCPKPKQTFAPPVNVVDRFLMRQTLPYRHTHQMFNRSDRNMLFSHYCPVRYYDVEDETITACNFSPSDEIIQVGMYSGDVHWINVESGATETTYPCHNSVVNSIKQSPDGALLLTSSLYVRPLSALWRLGEQPELMHYFAEDMDMSFGQLSHGRLIGTQMFTASIYDTETGEQICKLEDPDNSNQYARNKACFNCTDTLVLNDGIIWDIRANPTVEYVHKFDKLSPEYSGVFHPNDLEVLICGQVWDIRNYKLLTNVPALEGCSYSFNTTGDILFATAMKNNEELDEHIFFPTYDSSFRVFDAKDYHVITTVDTKRDLYAFGVDHRDRYVCTVETSRNREDEQTVCRLYEIGRVRAENDLEEEDIDDMESDGYDDEEDSVSTSTRSTGSEIDMNLLLDDYGNLIEQPAEDEEDGSVTDSNETDYGAVDEDSESDHDFDDELEIDMDDEEDAADFF